MKPKRQILFMMTDTTRHDMVGCYGNKAMKTPNLDELASQGVRFSRAYTTQPVCGPARSCIFTGLYPHGTGSFTNTVPLWQGVKTIGEYLQGAGIHTALIGKWHLDGGDYFGNGICPPGYDPAYWFDMRCYLEQMSEEDRRKSRKEATSLEGGGIPAEFTFGHQICDKAIDFVKKYKDEDFFLTISLDEPHGPYLCPEPYASMYKDYEMPITPAHRDDLSEKPEFEKLWGARRLHEDKQHLHLNPSLFFGCNSFADSEMGRVMHLVQELCPDAMIVYTSDHGEALDAHSLDLKGPSVYEEIAHIPLIIRGGACMQAPAGAVYDSVASHVDLVPTFLDYYGIEIPPSLSGVSMRSIIEHPEGKPLHKYVMCEFHRYEIDHDGFGGLQFMRAAIGDRYKLAEFLTDSDELFDDQADPYEVHNFINDPSYAQVRDEMHEYLMQRMNDTRDPFRGYQWRCRPWNTKDKKDWECDGYTRQRPSGKGELVQLDYDTGMEITETVRYKRKANGFADKDKA